MNGSETAILASAGDVVRLSLRRPPLNYLSLEMLSQIQSGLESIGDAPAERALVIDSGCAAFSAGLEMSQQTREAGFLLLDQFHTVARTLLAFPRPTIALVGGVALGAGNELAACCDFVLASTQATFGQPEIKVGTIPSLAPLLLPHRIGNQRTLQLILTGNPVDAGEAERIGLIHRAVPEDALRTALEELLAGFRGSSMAVMEVALRAARAARLRDLDNHLRDIQSLYLNDLMDLEDPSEGIRAFLERRAPEWKHR